jgi:hypothetical protein
MDTASALARFEAALADQLVLAGGDPAVEAAARSLQAALGPAARQLALDLAQQAATEVAAQLPEHDVEVVLDEGEPLLAVRAHEPATRVEEDEDYEARITLRLPPSLKGRLEEAARAAGDSTNSWVVEALSGAATRRSAGRPGRRVHGTVQT